MYVTITRLPPLPRQCLEAYTAAETLTEPYRCGKCGGSSAGCSKQFTLHKLPSVLVLHLKVRVK